MKFCILLLVFGSSQVIEEIPNYGSPPPAVLTSSLVYYDNAIYMFGDSIRKTQMNSGLMMWRKIYGAIF